VEDAEIPESGLAGFKKLTKDPKSFESASF